MNLILVPKTKILYVVVLQNYTSAYLKKFDKDCSYKSCTYL